MPAPAPIPDELRGGPFLHGDATRLGISEKVLRGSRFRRVFPRVWVHAAHEMTAGDWHTAAALALPPHARLSHLSRLQALGLDVGPAMPVHFTVAGDLHLAVEGIFLHRTEVLPPVDDVGVTPAAAFMSVAASMRLIDLVVIGDWLLHHGHLDVAEVAELAHRDRWRPGASQVRVVLPLLDARSRSPRESETRVLLVVAGLPWPEVNHDVVVAGRLVACVDLAYVRWRLAVEYEGRQHAEDDTQFLRDVRRYADLRDEGWEYVQVTKELLRMPRTMVRQVHRKLVERGYAGPPPTFGDGWEALFRPISRKAVT